MLVKQQGRTFRYFSKFLFLCLLSFGIEYHPASDFNLAVGKSNQPGITTLSPFVKGPFGDFPPGIDEDVHVTVRSRHVEDIEASVFVYGGFWETVLQQFPDRISQDHAALFHEFGLEIQIGGSPRREGNQTVVAGFATEADPLLVDGSPARDVESLATRLEALTSWQGNHSVDGVFAERVQGKKRVEVQLLGHGTSDRDFGSLEAVRTIGSDGIAPLIGDHDIEPRATAVPVQHQFASRAIGQPHRERNSLMGDELSAVDLQINVDLCKSLSLAGQKKEEDAG